MEWKILLYARRKEPLDIPDDLSKYPMNDFELDYWRIVNSAPFRRLQDKTQVFPLDKSDFVRTRLSGSAGCAQSHSCPGETPGSCPGDGGRARC